MARPILTLKFLGPFSGMSRRGGLIGSGAERLSSKQKVAGSIPA
ncbi:Uncharacterized protein BM_BM17404 [Brugia malayi]|uniref:Uncharacterized protein n=1 Tax=Brugia malayi TaxID=6279 RepID=A0A4E9F7X6_BRUMA|nr:Uncharacterized protein BM_BM17404 [Brugia malayi]VIO92136.1 Uncharacterized protein BM_BM17404 [Brugia malayi]